MRAFRSPVVTIIAGAVATVVVLTVAGYFISGGSINIRTTPEGPLDAGIDRAITLPLRAQDTGAAWGNLILTNGSPDSSITLDSVAFASPTGTLKQTSAPYVWDEHRYRISGHGALDAYQLPLPAAWTKVPKHPLPGYVLKPASATTDGDAPEAEVVFEFGVPPTAAGFKAVTVGYHIGTVIYRKTFTIGFVLCPPNDPTRCD